jgi:methylenetetrahydrofolate dehydrogenase (NADP+)/methenyltetrahydrofolate cyclohydrolase
LDGKKVAQMLKDVTKLQVSKLYMQPRLIIYSCGDNDASEVYVRNKIKAANYIGIKVEHRHFAANKFDDLMNDMANETYGSMIVQFPLPSKEMEERVRQYFKWFPEYDADGIGKEGYHLNDRILPCTPKGILTLLDYYDIPLRGQNVVIINRSSLVGKPLAQLMTEADATVTVCHTWTNDLDFYTRNADILITATGKPNLIMPQMVKKGAVVIDVGICRNYEGKLCGDVEYESVAPKCSYITPVPGGVGPMTVATLMQNVVELASKIEK